MQYDLPVRTLRNARDRHDAVGVGNAQFFLYHKIIAGYRGLVKRDLKRVVRNCVSLVDFC